MLRNYRLLEKAIAMFIVYLSQEKYLPPKLLYSIKNIMVVDSRPIFYFPLAVISYVP